MKKLIFCLAILATGLVSCGSSDDGKGQVETESCKIDSTSTEPIQSESDTITTTDTTEADTLK